MRVITVATVKDEAEKARALLESLVGQPHPPDHLVVVDEGSMDGTVDILRGYEDRLPLRVVVRRSRLRSLGGWGAFGLVIGLLRLLQWRRRVPPETYL